MATIYNDKRQNIKEQEEVTATENDEVKKIINYILELTDDKKTVIDALQIVSLSLKERRHNP